MSIRLQSLASRVGLHRERLVANVLACGRGAVALRRGLDHIVRINGASGSVSRRSFRSYSSLGRAQSDGQFGQLLESMVDLSRPGLGAVGHDRDPTKVLRRGCSSRECLPKRYHQQGRLCGGGRSSGRNEARGLNGAIAQTPRASLYPPSPVQRGDGSIRESHRWRRCRPSVRSMPKP